MSMARHHAEWMSLVETSGPFLSMPVLMRIFPQGLDAHDPEHAKRLRLAYQEWEDERAQREPDRQGNRTPTFGASVADTRRFRGFAITPTYADARTSATMLSEGCFVALSLFRTWCWQAMRRKSPQVVCLPTSDPVSFRCWISPDSTCDRSSIEGVDSDALP